MNLAAVVATSVAADGHREILGLDLVTSEDGAGWTAFLRTLVARGLSGVRLVISDDHTGLVGAIAAVLPGASWQRCRTHFVRNLLTRVPKSAQPFVATLVRSNFAQPSREEVEAQHARVVEQLEQPRVVGIQWGQEGCVALIRKGRLLSLLFSVTIVSILLVPPTSAFADDPNPDGPLAPNPPGALCCVGMTYAPSPTAGVVVYGGLDNVGLGHSQDVTRKWNWTFHEWEGVVLDSLPGAAETGRSSTRMVYFTDTAVARIVLFGGKTCDGVITPCPLATNQTWLFNGTTSSWADCGASCLSAPSARTSEGLAYDTRLTAAPVVVLFGGDSGDEPFGTPTASLQDTWTFDKTLQWTPCTLTNCPADAPRGRGTPGMDYDPITHNVDVFGGSNSNTLLPPNRFGDTWMFNTSVTTYWKQCTSSGADTCGPVSTNCASLTGPPCARFGHRMVWYDDGLGVGHQHMFTFGAGVPSLLNDVWFFSGAPSTGVWTRCDMTVEGCNPATTPPEPRCCVGLAFDTAQKKILLFGGAFTPVPSSCLDTWSWTQGGGWIREGTAAACDTVP